MKLIFHIIIIGLWTRSNFCNVIGNGPSMEDLERKKCPEQKPILCIPYGACCSYSEFCHAGLCESCFYDHVSANLLEWCRQLGQYNVSLMRSSSCRLACQNNYTSQDLVPTKNCNETKVPNSDKLKVEQNPNQSLQSDNTKLQVALAVIVTLLISSLVINVITCVVNRKSIGNHLSSALKLKAFSTTSPEVQRVVGEYKDDIQLNQKPKAKENMPKLHDFTNSNTPPG